MTLGSLELAPLQAPPVPQQTIAQIFGAEDSKVLKFILKGTDLLLTGGYFERYDKRVVQYNIGKLTYDQFVQANFIDALATTTATVVTFGVAGKINIVTAGAKTLATKLVAGGAAAGAAFDATLQAGLVFVGQVTDGVSGQEGISLPQVLTSGALGAGLGGALAGAGKVGSELYKATPALVENMLAKIGRVIGLDASRSKQLLARELSSEVGVSPELLAAKGSSKPKLQDVSTAEIYGETQIKVAGRVVATTPKASSLTLVDVASWFRGESNKVAGMIDKSLSIEAQIIQAQKLQQELMEGAVAALYDPALGASLREAFARPSIEKLMAEVGGAGEKQLKAVLDKLTAPDKTRKWFEPGACFAAGTLVHTKEGLVPIEQIKVGDYVLSKPENGGEQAYKRVLKTFEYPEETVIQILYALMEDLGKASRPAYPLTVTPNHPFWLSRSGWTAAREISANSANHGDNYELIDGTNVIPDGIQKLFISDLPGVGWMGNAVGSSIGALWDFVNHKLIANDVPVREDILDDEVEDPFLRLTVYNLEVEDFHTYYVGKHGVWVHNQNCDGLRFDVQGNAPQLTAKQTERPFLSRKEATDYFEGKTLQELNLKEEIYLMPASKPSQVNGIPEDAWARWVKHEEQVSGRIKDNNGIRMEYVLPFEDPLTGKINVIGIEGATLTPSLKRINVDSKLAYVKADDIQGALRALETAAARWKQTGGANGGEFFQYLFPARIRNPEVELIGIQKARDVFNKIRNSDPDYQLLKRTVDANGVRILVVDVERNNLLREFLGPNEQSSFIELLTTGFTSIFPQNVLAEGPAASVTPLTLAQVNALLPVARQYWLSAGASASMLNSATFQIDDLPAGLAGQTQGKTITLDARGAGWGWFVDTTPTEQAEFDAAASSATSAYDFNAPLSSEAFGKLDLLTVLIHELGHVVGLPSTATADNVMSQYLAAGQRRLPDAVDIAALQAKGSPYYSIGTSVTLVAPPAGDAGSLSYSQLHPAAAVINPTLANGNFAAGLVQWASAGKLDATPSTLTLSESTTAQAHLAQAFVLSAQDRFLTFTVSGLNLQTNSIEQNGIFTAAPQDAFEVALQNANTGANLLAIGSGNIDNSNLGTSHSDALLNLQLASSSAVATLQERAVSGLRHTDNADGSRSLTVNADGSFSYQGNKDYFGADSIRIYP